MRVGWMNGYSEWQIIQIYLYSDNFLTKNETRNFVIPLNRT